ncbi:hypothetical protein A4F85_01190 [Delftia sp. GW456-R20]|nr:hypothetical protein A4F85_01190 [Delftia sp. GW456-R20]
MQIHDQAGALRGRGHHNDQLQVLVELIDQLRPAAPLRGRGQHIDQLQVLVELIDQLRPAAAPPRPGQRLVLGQLASWPRHADPRPPGRRVARPRPPHRPAAG